MYAMKPKSLRILRSMLPLGLTIGWPDVLDSFGRVWCMWMGAVRVCICRLPFASWESCMYMYMYQHDSVIWYMYDVVIGLQSLQGSL